MVTFSGKSRVNLKAFNKHEMDRGASRFKEAVWYLVKVLFFLTPLPFPSRFKVFLLKIFGAKIGNSVVIRPKAHIYMPWKLEIGNYVWIGEDAYLLNLAPIRIGSNVIISQRAFICTGNHDFSDPLMPGKHSPVTLEDGVWIGAACFIGPGLTIGTDTVITAGSVVTSSLEENGIYRGNPAVYVKQRWRS